MSSISILRRISGRTAFSWLYCLKRLFWAVMLILHTAPIHAVTLRALQSSNNQAVVESWWSLIGLGLSAIFFVLKVADVSWLRRNPGWRSAVASTMIVAVVHVGVLERLSPAISLSQATPIGVIMFATLMTDMPRALRGTLRSLWRQFSQRCGEQFNLAVLPAWRGWIDYHFHLCQHWFRLCLPARAPPALMPA